MATTMIVTAHGQLMFNLVMSFTSKQSNGPRERVGGEGYRSGQQRSMLGNLCLTVPCLGFSGFAYVVARVLA